MSIQQTTYSSTNNGVMFSEMGMYQVNLHPSSRSNRIVVAFLDLYGRKIRVYLLAVAVVASTRGMRLLSVVILLLGTDRKSFRAEVD